MSNTLPDVWLPKKWKIVGVWDDLRNNWIKADPDYIGVEEALQLYFADKVELEDRFSHGTTGINNRYMAIRMKKKPAEKAK